MEVARVVVVMRPSLPSRVLCLIRLVKARETSLQRNNARLYQHQQAVLHRSPQTHHLLALHVFADGSGWDSLHRAGQTEDFLNIIDDSTYEWTSDENRARASANNYYPGSEGIQFHEGQLYFMAKTIHKNVCIGCG